MGEHADDMLEGRACCVCGCWLDEYLEDDDYDGCGYPVMCASCAQEAEQG